MTKRNLLPYNLQFFAEQGGAETTGTTSSSAATGRDATGRDSSVANVDYEKIQKMLDGTLKAKEDTALKAYFKQQGLSQEEAEQAMTAFKQKKAENTPDVNALNTQLKNANMALHKAQIEQEATLVSLGLGLDAKTIPYVIKMADLSQVMKDDGKIDNETLTNALKKVLEDIPGLKPQATNSTGFQKVGATGTQSNQTTSDDALKAAFGLK